MGNHSPRRTLEDFSDPLIDLYALLLPLVDFTPAFAHCERWSAGCWPYMTLADMYDREPLYSGQSIGGLPCQQRADTSPAYVVGVGYSRGR